MGMCYSVILTPKFKDNDPTQFCSILRRKAIEWQLNGSRQPERDLYTEPGHGQPVAEIYNMDDPLECFKVFTAEDVFEDSTEGKWIADFDASYGWDDVLQDVFEEAVTALEEGAEIKIMPDDYAYRFYVENGTVKAENCDEEDEDDEDYDEDGE